jgi:uncharacterized protein YcbX
LVSLGSVVISKARRELDEAGVAVHSTEFNLYGDGESLAEALSAFLGQATDYVEFVADSARSGDATQYELRVSLELASRLVRAAEHHALSEVDALTWTDAR